MDQQLKEWRNQGIGGSDAPIIMNGVHFGKTPYMLWQEKVFGLTDDKDNYAMKRGRDKEEEARQQFEALMKTCVIPKPVIHKDINWMRANLDGISLDGKILVEIKCPGKDDHAEAVSKKVPSKYMAQCQHQLEVTGLEGMYYFSFDGHRGAVVEVERDQAYIDEMLEKETKFWASVTSQEPPKLNEHDYVDLSFDQTWEKSSSELWEVRSMIKALEEKDAELLGILKSLAQGRNTKGTCLKLMRQINKGAIDYSIVPQLKGVDLEPYRKKSFEKWTPYAI